MDVFSTVRGVPIEFNVNFVLLILRWPDRWRAHARRPGYQSLSRGPTLVFHFLFACSLCLGFLMVVIIFAITGLGLAKEVVPYPSRAQRQRVAESPRAGSGSPASAG